LGRILYWDLQICSRATTLLNSGVASRATSPSGACDSATPHDLDNVLFDDTYVADAPRPALEAMLEGDALAQKWSGVESNVSKRQIWAPDPASLEAVRDYPSVRGTPAAPPDGKYAGGTLRGIRVLGAYLGDDEWRKTELVARVERALKPLEGILELRDTKEIHTAQQVMQVLLRFCSNTTLTFFLCAPCRRRSPSRQRRGTTS